jgi:subtilisin family serine protease
MSAPVAPRTGRTPRGSRRALGAALVACGLLAALGGPGPASAVSSAPAAPAVAPATGPAVAPGTPPAQPPAGDAAAIGPDREDGRYVVVLRDRPVVGYAGGVPGYAATRPAPGQKATVDDPDAERYRDLLVERQSAVLAEVGAPSPLYRYTTALNGFAADLTGAQADALAKDPAVLAVRPSELLQPDTRTSPAFLGLTGPDGVWARLGGTGPAGAGAGVVVGVVDSGISPDSASFADRGLPSPPGWSGTCQTGPGFEEADCTNKLVGARFFVDGFGADRVAESDPLSPLDVNGHGTHTASTAAGNPDVPAVVDGRELGTVSGMAPAAHVAAYKVCWESEAQGGCNTLDVLAAVDQAVADGVDVINFSISGTQDDYLDPVETAFRAAAAAGIFVAASSGNSGPGASTTNHPAPWVTTVAASTHQLLEQTLVTGDGRRTVGVSGTGPLPDQTPVVLADAVPAPGADPGEAGLCLPGTLDDAAVAGSVVVCDRGENPRAQKSQVVADAGGVGMVLVNTEPNSLDPDLHAVPAVHLPVEERAPLREYVSGAAAPTAAIVPTAPTDRGPDDPPPAVPDVAPFSSRGPSAGAGGDLLKPDISAPGVGVLAATSPATGRDFDVQSGTSMSAPHISGLAALLRQAHPTWSPMAIQSAMMTTAREHAGAAGRDVLAVGAGMVEPRRFLDPGLVYDSGPADWDAFLAGQGVPVLPGQDPPVTPLPAPQLNRASVAVGSLVGTSTVTRTVTDVSDAGTRTWTPEVTGMDGVDVTVSPAQLTTAAGESATFTVTFATRDAPLDEWVQGHLVWRSGEAEVRSPLVVRPRPLAVPGAVEGSGVSGTATLEVVAGSTAPVPVTVDGLAAGATATGSVEPGPPVPFDDASNDLVPLHVPPGTSLVRVEVDGEEGDDVDLFLLRIGGQDIIEVVDASLSPGPDETVEVAEPEPGPYLAVVNGFSTAEPGGTADYASAAWVVPTGPTGNLTVEPEILQPGAPGETLPLVLTWQGLEPGGSHLGVLRYEGVEDRTLVRITS